MATTTAAPEAAPAAEGKKGGKKKLIIIAVVLLVVIGAAAYFFVLKPKGGEEAPPPEPGQVLTMEPITLNLAEGRYLRLGMALQFTATAGGGGHGGGAPDGSKALDIAIAQFSGKTVEELSAGKARTEAKKHLLHEIEEAYHHEVMDIYFTEFVMQ